MHDERRFRGIREPGSATRRELIAGALGSGFALAVRPVSAETITTGAEGLLGLKGRALTGIAPEGRVEIQGELWQARARMKIAAGERIRVIGMDGLTLEVEPAPDDALPPRPVSAVAPPEESDNS